jgi:hypothetical protein
MGRGVWTVEWEAVSRMQMNCPATFHWIRGAATSGYGFPWFDGTLPDRKSCD